MLEVNGREVFSNGKRIGFLYSWEMWRKTIWHADPNYNGRVMGGRFTGTRESVLQELLAYAKAAVAPLEKDGEGC